jgi:hypothetical protein
MTTRLGSDVPPQSDYGPTLPVLLRRRFGVRAGVTRIVALALAAAAAGALIYSLATGPEQIVYRAGPTFNLQYSSDVLHRVAPQGVELVRLEAEKGTLSASITVSRLRLPPYTGNVTSGLLPVYIADYEQDLGRALVDFQLRDEGSARVNDAQGYQIGFRSGPAGHFTWGRDMMLVPGDEDVTEGVVLRLRQTKAGRVTKADTRVLDDVKKAFRSFNFGTDRAKW